MTTIGPTGNGLGLFDIGPASGFKGLGHNGFVGGYISIMGIDPESGNVLVILTNNDELRPGTLAWLLALRW